MHGGAWRLLLVLALQCACFSQAHAARSQDAPNAIALQKQQHCGDGNMLQMSMCMSREAKESDERLNLVYGRLMEALAKPRSLREVQRKWIAFRDAECKFRTEASQGGSIHNFSLDLCRTQLTEQRIATLESIRRCETCVEFKAGYAGPEGFSLPRRSRIPASMAPLDGPDTGAGIGPCGDAPDQAARPISAAPSPASPPLADAPTSVRSRYRRCR